MHLITHQIITIVPTFSSVIMSCNRIVNAVFPCMSRRKPWLTDLKASAFSYLPRENEKSTLPYEQAAIQIVDILFNASSSDSIVADKDTKTKSPSYFRALTSKINDIAYQAGGWHEWLAQRVLQGMESAIKAGKEMSPAFVAVYERAYQAAEIFEGFARDHPVFVTLVGVGILVVLAPYVLEILGFGELGIVEGESTSTFS